MLCDQRLQKCHDITGHSLNVGLVALRKLLQDVLDPARSRQHAPDFARNLVEIEIRSRLQAENDKSAVDLGGR